MRKLNLIQGTKAWLDYRNNGVGASDIGNIASSTGAFKTRAQVLEEKISGGKPISPFLDNLFKEGHEWEQTVREHLNKGNYKFAPVVVEHEYHPRMFASLDGLDEELKLILEVKSCSNKDRFESITKSIPENYRAQMQWQMFCVGLDRVLFAVVYEGEVHTQYVERDDKEIERLKGIADEFLKELDAARERGLTPSLPPGIPEVQELLLLKASLERAEERVFEVSCWIRETAEKLLEEYGATKLENEYLTISRVERKGAVDYKRVPELQGVDLEPYRKPPSSFVKVTLKNERTESNE